MTKCAKSKVQSVKISKAARVAIEAKNLASIIDRMDGLPPTEAGLDEFKDTYCFDYSDLKSEDDSQEERDVLQEQQFLCGVWILLLRFKTACNGQTGRKKQIFLDIVGNRFTDFLLERDLTLKGGGGKSPTLSRIHEIWVQETCTKPKAKNFKLKLTEILLSATSAERDLVLSVLRRSLSLRHKVDVMHIAEASLKLEYLEPIVEHEEDLEFDFLEEEDAGISSPDLCRSDSATATAPSVQVSAEPVMVSASVATAEDCTDKDKKSEEFDESKSLSEFCAMSCATEEPVRNVVGNAFSALNQFGIHYHEAMVGYSDDGTMDWDENAIENLEATAVTGASTIQYDNPSSQENQQQQQQDNVNVPPVNVGQDPQPPSPPAQISCSSFDAVSVPPWSPAVCSVECQHSNYHEVLQWEIPYDNTGSCTVVLHRGDGVCCRILLFIDPINCLIKYDNESCGLFGWC